MLNYFQILLLAVIQGLCELLPVSSSAHVIMAEKLMHVDPSAPEMTMLLVMLHTGTMFAVVVYFWKRWMRGYFSSRGQLQWFCIQILIASACTAVIYEVVKKVMVKVLLHDPSKTEVEDLFNNLPLVAGALAAVGLLIIIAGLKEEKTPREREIQPKHSVFIGLMQGVSLALRGFSRSGSTISTGLLLGLPKQKLEEFSFALAVVLTPAAIAQEGLRLVKENHDATGGHLDLGHLFLPSLVGMVFSFIAGLFALKWLSRWLEAGRWMYFGCYCVLAAVAVYVIHLKVP